MTFRQLAKSKTVIFAVVVAVLSALQGFVFAIPIEPHWQAVIGVVLAVAVTLLRIVTKEPIGDK
jgi:urea transporter